MQVLRSPDSNNGSILTISQSYSRVNFEECGPVVCMYVCDGIPGEQRDRPHPADGAGTHSVGADR